MVAGVPLYVDDLDSEWTTLRGLSPAKVVVEDVNLRQERWALADHPEWVYRFNETYSLRQLGIWRYKCQGQRVVHGTYFKPTDCWVGAFESVVWAGEDARIKSGVHVSDLDEETLHALRIRTHFISLPKRHCYTTLESLRAAFLKFRDDSLQRCQSDIAVAREQVRRAQETIASNESHIATMQNFVPQDLNVSNVGS